MFTQEIFILPMMTDIGCLDLQVQYYVGRTGKYHCHHLDGVGKYFKFTM